MNFPEEIDRYSRLFVSIIVQAVLDAGTKPTREEQREGANRLSEAASAMEYLFGRNRGVFATHAALIGADAEQIREALLYRDRPLGMQHAIVPAEKLRILRIRHRWHQKGGVENV